MKITAKIIKFKNELISDLTCFSIKNNKVEMICIIIYMLFVLSAFFAPKGITIFYGNYASSFSFITSFIICFKTERKTKYLYPTILGGLFLPASFFLFGDKALFLPLIIMAEGYCAIMIGMSIRGIARKVKEKKGSKKLTFRRIFRILIWGSYEEFEDDYKKKA